MWKGGAESTNNLCRNTFLFSMTSGTLTLVGGGQCASKENHISQAPLQIGWHVSKCQAAMCTLQVQGGYVAGSLLPPLPPFALERSDGWSRGHLAALWP